MCNIAQPNSHNTNMHRHGLVGQSVELCLVPSTTRCVWILFFDSWSFGHYDSVAAVTEFHSFSKEKKKTHRKWNHVQNNMDNNWSGSKPIKYVLFARKWKQKEIMKTLFLFVVCAESKVGQHAHCSYERKTCMCVRTHKSHKFKTNDVVCSHMCAHCITNENAIEN